MSWLKLQDDEAQVRVLATHLGNSRQPINYLASVFLDKYAAFGQITSTKCTLTINLIMSLLESAVEEQIFS